MQAKQTLANTSNLNLKQAWQLRLVETGEVPEPDNEISSLLVALSDADLQTRVRAIRSLGFLHKYAAGLRIQPLLQDPIWLVREAAVDTLTLLNDQSAIPALRVLVYQIRTIRIVYAHQHRTMLKAIGALVYLKDTQVESLLLKLLRQGYEDATFEWQLELRRVIISHLAQLETVAAVKALLALLGESPYDEIWLAVVEALSTLQSETGFHQLLKALKPRFLENPTETWCRQEVVAVALGRIGNRRALPYLLRLAASPSSTVRQAQAWAVACLGYETAPFEVEGC